MGAYYFAIPPEEYIYTFSYTTECLIGFEAMQDDTWLIGDVFLRSYYSVWDHDNDRIGLSPHKTSYATSVTVASVPLPVNSFQYTNVMDVAFEIFEIAWRGISLATAVGTLYFIADVIITHIEKVYFG